MCESAEMLAECHGIKAPSYLSCHDAKFSLAHPPRPDNSAASSGAPHARTKPRSLLLLTLLLSHFVILFGTLLVDLFVSIRLMSREKIINKYRWEMLP